MSKSNAISQEEANAVKTEGVSPEVEAMLAKNKAAGDFTDEHAKIVKAAINKALEPYGAALYTLIVVRPIASNAKGTASADAVLKGATPDMAVVNGTTMVGALNGGMRQHYFDLATDRE